MLDFYIADSEIYQMYSQSEIIYKTMVFACSLPTYLTN